MVYLILAAAVAHCSPLAFAIVRFGAVGDMVVQAQAFVKGPGKTCTHPNGTPHPMMGTGRKAFGLVPTEVSSMRCTKCKGFVMRAVDGDIICINCSLILEYGRGDVCYPASTMVAFAFERRKKRAFIEPLASLTEAEGQWS